MSEIIKGFQTTEGTKKYDYKSLANLPEKATDYIGLDKVNNTSDMEKPVSAAQKNAIDLALQAAKEYADGLIFNNSDDNNPTNEIIYITMGESFEDLTSSHTAEQIIQAVEAGRVPICALVFNGDAIAFSPTALTADTAIFTTIIDLEGFVILTITIFDENVTFGITPLITAIPDTYVTSDELTDEVVFALEEAKQSGDFKGEPGEDYVLTEADKQEIAELASKLIKIPETDSGNINLSGYATEEWAKEKFVLKEEYLTNEDKENLTNEIIDKIFSNTLFIMNCGKAEI